MLFRVIYALNSTDLIGIFYAGFFFKLPNALSKPREFSRANRVSLGVFAVQSVLTVLGVNVAIAVDERNDRRQEKRNERFHPLSPGRR